MGIFKGFWVFLKVLNVLLLLEIIAMNNSSYFSPTSDFFYLSLYLGIYLFAVLVFELRASYLLGRCSTTWATPPALFIYLFIGGTGVWTQHLVLATSMLPFEPHLQPSICYKIWIIEGKNFVYLLYLWVRLNEEMYIFSCYKELKQDTWSCLFTCTIFAKQK
jgi:hypothetical protein